MSSVTIDRLIINSPYTEPSRHWHYERETRLFSPAEGHHSAGYVVASESSRGFDVPGRQPMVLRLPYRDSEQLQGAALPTAPEERLRQKARGQE